MSKQKKRITLMAVGMLLAQANLPVIQALEGVENGEESTAVTGPALEIKETPPAVEIEPGVSLDIPEQPAQTSETPLTQRMEEGVLDQDTVKKQLIVNKDILTEDLPYASDKTAIEELTLQWLTQDTAEDDSKNILTQEWDADTKQAVEFEWVFSVTGVQAFPKHTVQFKLPKEVIKDEKGNTTGNISFHLPVLEDGTEVFEVYEQEEYYIISNIKSLPALLEGRIGAVIENINPLLMEDVLVTEPMRIELRTFSETGQEIGAVSEELVILADIIRKEKPESGEQEKAESVEQEKAETGEQEKAETGEQEKTETGEQEKPESGELEDEGLESGELEYMEHSPRMARLFNALNVSTVENNSKFAYQFWPLTWPEELRPVNHNDYVYADWDVSVSTTDNQPYTIQMTSILDNYGGQVLAYHDLENDEVIPGNGAQLTTQIAQNNSVAGGHTYKGRVYAMYPKSGMGYYPSFSHTVRYAVTNTNTQQTTNEEQTATQIYVVNDDIEYAGDATFSMSVQNVTEGSQNTPLELTFEIYDDWGSMPTERTYLVESDSRPPQYVKHLGTINIHHGETLTIKDVPEMSDIYITLTVPSGFTINGSSEEVIYIEYDYVENVDFEVRYNLTQPGTWQPEVNLNLESGTLNNYNFNVAMRRNGSLIQQAQVLPDGSVPFSPITYAVSEYGNTYTYTFQAVDEGQENIVYDDTVYEVVVRVTDDGYGQIIGVSESPAVEITNQFVSNYEWTPEASLWLRSASMSDYSFDFILYEGTGGSRTEVERVSNQSNGTIEFSPIEFGLEDVGQTYQYTITQVNDGQSNIRYDQTEYRYEVAVTQNAQGEVIGTVTTSTGEPIVFRNYFSNDLPATGTYGVLILVGVAVILIVVSVVLNKVIKEDETKEDDLTTDE